MDAIKILGTLLSNNAMGSPAGGNILDSLLGGGSSSSGAGDILGTLLGGRKRGGGGGGLGALGAILAAAAAKGGKGNTSGGDLLGSLLGAATSGGGNNPLAGILGAAANSSSGTNGTELLGGGQEAAPPKEAQEEAEILIAAMCNAAKADGTIDDAEKEAILGRLGDLDDEEIVYLQEHLSGPVNLAEFTSNVPDDMDEQVSAFSLMAIKLDTQKEAEYFGKLANGLGLDGDTCNQIHARPGQPEIFA